MALITTLLTITVASLAAVTGLLKHVADLKEAYLRVAGSGKIIGVVNCWPEELSELQEFTSFRKCLFYPASIKVLRCRSISYALRHCDFVVARCNDDPKIVSPDDHVALQALKT